MFPTCRSDGRMDRMSKVLRSSLGLVLHLSQGGHDIYGASFSSGLLNSGIL
jgi:hypothetical protein